MKHKFFAAVFHSDLIHYHNISCAVAMSTRSRRELLCCVLPRKKIKKKLDSGWRVVVSPCYFIRIQHSQRL